MATAMMENNLNRALELLGGSIDPEIEESYASIEARILAQALENSHPFFTITLPLLLLM